MRLSRFLELRWLDGNLPVLVHWTLQWNLVQDKRLLCFQVHKWDGVVTIVILSLLWDWDTEGLKEPCCSEPQRTLVDVTRYSGAQETWLMGGEKFHVCWQYSELDVVLIRKCTGLDLVSTFEDIVYTVMTLPGNNFHIFCPLGFLMLKMLQKPGQKDGRISESVCSQFSC